MICSVSTFIRFISYFLLTLTHTYTHTTQSQARQAHSPPSNRSAPQHYSPHPSPLRSRYLYHHNNHSLHQHVLLAVSLQLRHPHNHHYNQALIQAHSRQFNPPITQHNSPTHHHPQYQAPAQRSTDNCKFVWWDLFLLSSSPSLRKILRIIRVLYRL
jgi:hypothetical protein